MSTANDIKGIDLRCPYCGGAPISHRFSYIESIVHKLADRTIGRLGRHSPKIFERIADAIPVLLFKMLSLVNLSQLSSDISKANSDRSRLIWQEAIDRGIDMKQVVIGKRHLDIYRAVLNGRPLYFESLPIQPQFLNLKKDWDNKIILKKELSYYGIPVPKHARIAFGRRNLGSIFSKFETPVIVKPEIGSRGRHTVTNIRNLEDFKKAVKLSSKISAYLVAEEHLSGYICRATIIGGTIAGFYRGEMPYIMGDGQKTIRELIKIKDSKTLARYNVPLTAEFHDHIARAGYTIDDVLPENEKLTLSHRAGQLFGGNTKEMLPELHPSFIPILERAATVLGLSIVGLDCIIPDPTKDENSQRWGIIEANTLPFIDVHYFALEGKPSKNIPGMIWDLWKE